MNRKKSFVTLQMFLLSLINWMHPCWIKGLAYCNLFQINLTAPKLWNSSTRVCVCVRVSVFCSSFIIVVFFTGLEIHSWRTCPLLWLNVCPSPLLRLYVPVRPSWSAEFGLADGIPGVRHFYRVGQVSRLCVRTLRHPPYDASPFKFSRAPLRCSRTSHHRRSTSSMTSRP